MQNLTKPIRQPAIQHHWHLVDVKDQVLGRVTTKIAGLLMGKYKPYYTRNLDCGDYVVVINAKLVKVTGRKEKEKLYSNYSGYPGGLKQKALWQVRSEKPTEIIRHSVAGMIPHNKLQAVLLKRLYIYPEGEHPYQAKFTPNHNVGTGFTK